MRMNWQHKTSAEWLKARKSFLTASEIAKIVPVTDTGRKRSRATIEANMLAIFANKNTLTVDTHSSGAMARGHILEAWAIDEVPNAYHWDDAILFNGKYPSLGYSPDGLSIPQPAEPIVFSTADLPHIEKIIEVKSYNPERHLALATADLETMPERWQLAAAMMVTEAEEGVLVGYNPEMYGDYQVIYRHFDFSTFADEMQMIEEAVADYKAFALGLTKVFSNVDSKPALVTYDEICQQYMEEQQSTINPS